MKKNSFSLSLLLTFHFFFAQSPLIQWQNLSYNAYPDYPECVIQTNDNGFLVLSSKSENNISTNYHLLKLDIDGNLLWQWSYGGSNNDQASEVIQTSDGGYILIGTTTSNNGDVSGNHINLGYQPDVWVVKLDSQGLIEWQKCLGGSYEDVGKSIRQTSDGGYIIVASTHSINSIDGDVVGLHYNNITGNNSDYWVVKLDSTGTIEWQKCIGGTNSDEPNKIILTSDGGYLIGGRSFSSDGDALLNHGFADFWLVKTNNLGEIEWQKSIGGNSNDSLTDIEQTADGDYIVVGSTASNSGDFSSAGTWRILKLNNSGSIVWNRGLFSSPYFDGPYDMEINPQNNQIFLIGTDSTYVNSYNTNIQVVHLSQDGFFITKTIFGGTSNDYGARIDLTSDNSIIIMGDARSLDGDIVGPGIGSNNQHTWVAKLLPNVLLSIDEITNSSDFVLFPNPVKDVLYINSENSNISDFTVYDNLGRLVLNNLNINEGIDMSMLISGIYFVHIKSEKGEISKRKILKE